MFVCGFVFVCSRRNKRQLLWMLYFLLFLTKNDFKGAYTKERDQEEIVF